MFIFGVVLKGETLSCNEINEGESPSCRQINEQEAVSYSQINKVHCLLMLRQHSL